MSFPLYIIGGGAGSGKDTVADMMIAGRNGVTIAQADPMKRFFQEGLGFTEEQLWGPSAMRNAPDNRFALIKGGKLAFEKAREKIFYSGYAERWLIEIGAPAALRPLERWFEKLIADFLVDDKVLTPRAGLQLLGTEFGRAIDPDVWSNLAIRYSGLLLRGGWLYSRTRGLVPDKNYGGAQFAVITDGRFRNEILNVKALGGQAVQVFNPADDADRAKVDAAGVKGHVSESELRGIPRDWYDVLLENDKIKGLESLRTTIDGFFPKMLRGEPVFREQHL